MQLIKPPTPQLGRPPDRHNAIYAALVKRIVQGEFPPGSRLPTRRDLSIEFDASSRTVQAVLKDLAKFGFTEPQGSRGTFIQANPPHLHRHALVIDWGDDPNLYVTALYKEAERLQKEGWALDIIRLKDDGKRMETIRKLGSQLSRHLYAGLIFHREPDNLKGTPLMDVPNMPRVVLSRGVYTEGKAYKLSAEDPFMLRAIERIHQWGCSRVGLFLHAFRPTDVEESMNLLRANHLETRSAWIHTIHLNFPREAHAVLELIFSLPVKKRPDVFVVENDNLTETVTLGVRDFCPAGETLPIISHCNYPWQPKVHTPVTWLGFDVREMLLQSIKLIERRRRLERPSDKGTAILPRFEEELVES